MKSQIPTAAIGTIAVSVVMPCPNEAETLAVCIRKAFAAIQATGVEGEVIVADNGSTDGSQGIAIREGARVIDVPVRGYGAALTAGVEAARGEYVLMADADDSYDFGHLPRFLDALNRGAELVMGNRFKGGIRRGAMPLLHHYLGNPVLSFLGRLFFRTPIGFPLRHTSVHQIGHHQNESAFNWYGIRQRDGGKGWFDANEYCGGANDFISGRPHACAAPAHMARRVASFASASPL